MILKLPRKFFSLAIFEYLSFTPAFYSAVERRLIPQQKQLLLDIKPGDGCGGFSYEFKSLAESSNPEWMLDQ